MTATVNDNTNGNAAGATGLEKKLGESSFLCSVGSRDPRLAVRQESGAHGNHLQTADRLCSFCHPPSSFSFSSSLLHPYNMLTPSSAGVNINSGSAYVPPYLRARQAQKPAFNGAAPTPAPAGNGYRPSPTGLPTPAPTPVPSGTYNPPTRGGASDGGWGARGGGGRGGDRFERGTAPGVGAWRDGKHVTGARNPRLEKELFGEEGDGVHQVSFPVHLL